MGRGAFTRQLLHGMGRGSGGVRRRQLASAIMPHGGRDRHPLSLHPALCRYSRHGAGLRSSERTCLTPPPTVPPNPCTFFPCRTFGGHGRRPSNNSTALDQRKTCPTAPSTSHLLRREAPRAQQSSPHHQLALQDADTPWAQSKDTQGRHPHPMHTPDAALHSAQRQGRPTVLPRTGGRGGDP